MIAINELLTNPRDFFGIFSVAGGYHPPHLSPAFQLFKYKTQAAQYRSYSTSAPFLILSAPSALVTEILPFQPRKHLHPPPLFLIFLRRRGVTPTIQILFHICSVPTSCLLRSYFLSAPSPLDICREAPVPARDQSQISSSISLEKKG